MCIRKAHTQNLFSSLWKAAQDQGASKELEDRRRMFQKPQALGIFVQLVSENVSLHVLLRTVSFKDVFAHLSLRTV